MMGKHHRKLIKRRAPKGNIGDPRPGLLMREPAAVFVLTHATRLDLEPDRYVRHLLGRGLLRQGKGPHLLRGP